MFVIIRDENPIQDVSVGTGEACFSMRRDVSATVRTGLFVFRSEMRSTIRAEQRLILSAAETGKRKEDIQKKTLRRACMVGDEGANDSGFQPA